MTFQKGGLFSSLTTVLPRVLLVPREGRAGVALWQPSWLSLSDEDSSPPPSFPVCTAALAQDTRPHPVLLQPLRPRLGLSLAGASLHLQLLLV